MKTRDLIHEASLLGASVHVQHFDDDKLLGYFDPITCRIVLRLGMTVRETRCVLAHEVAHAYFRHDCSTPSNEREAERTAAMMMIEPGEYARAERISDDIFALADELDVTVDLVEVYQRECLQRLGRRTYGRSWRTGLSGALARQLSS